LASICKPALVIRQTHPDRYWCLIPVSNRLEPVKGSRGSLKDRRISGCYWVNNGGNSLFGVWIHFNYQMFRLGPRPIWYVFSHGMSNWQLSGDDPSQPYTWPKSLGFNVVGSPTSGANSLSINVTITDITG